MKVLYISKYVIFPEYGSPTRQYFFSKFLANKNNKVQLIGSRSTLGIVPEFTGLHKTRQDGNLELVTLNGPKINLGFNLKRMLSWIVFEFNIFRFRKKIKFFQPDIIIVSSLSILTFLSGVFLKRWLKIPLVIEVRDIYPLTLIEIGGYSKFNPLIILLEWIEKLGYKNADLIISTLPNASEHFNRILKKTFNFFWLPMGVDVSYYNINKDDIDLQINKNQKEDFIVGYAGTIGKANALEVIFDTACILDKTHQKIKFVLIGEGPLKAFYVEKYKNLSNLIFLPSVHKKDLPSELTNCDILINTWLDKPIYRFGISPNKWIDYMYAAKPILVAYNGYKCIIDEAQCGLFVPAEDSNSLKDAIIHFSNCEKESLKSMGERGKSYVINNLSYEVLTEKLTEKLKEIIETYSKKNIL